ncbi:MAG: PAS domain-containing protein [Lentisphaerae bacterium]|nr:PAS domain-containing protein [Lentisphaerota bacterium]
MEEKKKLSQTMRIDLIPDTPTEPVKGKRVIIAQPTQRHRSVQIDLAKDAVVRGADSHYQELLQSVYDAALITDLEGRITDFNVRAMEFLQYNREEMHALTIFDVIAGANESLIEDLSGTLEGERFTLIQAYCIRKDGTFFPSEIAVNKLRLDALHLCFFVRDITLRRQAEEMLRTEHNAIQNAGNGIAVANLEAKLEYVNPALAAMWGYEDSSELLGMDVDALLLDKEKAAEMVEAAINDNETWIGESIATRYDESVFDVQVSAACNRNSDGEPVGIVFSFMDISDRIKAQEAIREAERHRVMLESLGAACHHLGQPATVLLANLGIIQRKIDGAEDVVQDLVQTSIEAAETLGEILHKLNTVNEYKTTQYLDRPDGSDSEENRILDI